MPVYHCKLIPLTPIHVGAGETIALEDYFLANGRLTRFHPPAVLRAMSDAERKRYLALLGGGDTNMADALKLLRQCAQKAPASWIYSIEVGPASRQALAEAVEKVETRRGEVHPLIWNELKQEAVLPGSAIKGAIRTALLSAKVVRTGTDAPMWQHEWERRLRKETHPNGVARLAQELEQELFRQQHSEIEWDPFRFVKVSDAAIPQQMVRLDRAVLLGPRGENGARKIQMHFERLLSQSDGGAAPVLEFTISLEREEKSWHRGIVPYLGKVPTRDYLLQCLNYHYRQLRDREAQRFPELYQHPWKNWLEQGGQTNTALVRIGRFSHFECLSVHLLRRTQDRRRQWVTEGASRTYCTPDGAKKMPFGWALLQVA
ncbi:MAG: type III-A CRISPR-associated RAMP protein Csm5 [Bryobacteraceae bacterium]|nr:type III-A CRISPR-associated RAMP protein Csm5 [Bryobacteraceae bacterium]